MRGCVAGPWAGGLAEGGPTQERGRSCPWTRCRKCWARTVAGEASVMLAWVSSSDLHPFAYHLHPPSREEDIEEERKNKNGLVYFVILTGTLPAAILLYGAASSGLSCLRTDTRARPGHHTHAGFAVLVYTCLRMRVFLDVFLARGRVCPLPCNCGANCQG